MEYEIPLKDKPFLTVNEAAALLNIGTKRLYAMAEKNPKASFLLHDGRKLLFKRERLIAYLDGLNEI